MGKILAAGPSAADRAEMFNAVSKSTAENLGLVTLFEANQSCWQAAQKDLNDLLSGDGTNEENQVELVNAIKYAADTSAAMKVLLRLEAGSSSLSALRIISTILIVWKSRYLKLIDNNPMPTMLRP